MKAFTKLPLALLFLFILVGCSPKQDTRVEMTFEERIDSLFSTVPDFSGVVLVAEKGRPIYDKFFGYLNFESTGTLNAQSVFELASLSKQFTAMVIMMLKEEGKLTYDDYIEKYLLGLPYKNITIRHLLTHTSGLPDYQKIMDENWDKTKVAGNEDILKYLKKYHPEKQFEPGEKYEYSNTGYVLLASIAEKTSEKDFVEFCRERIFDPLSMFDTDIRSQKEKELIENFALGHIYVMEKQRYVRADSFPASNYTIWLGNRKGPGRISSTASDLLKWDQALYSERLVKKATLKEAFTPMKLNNDSLSNYGFGWKIETSELGKVVRHSGDNPGYKTHIIRFVEADKTVILLCNNAHEKYGEILKNIEELIVKPY
ncbi:MAG: beta-lactamase family protein [Bacteroidia bacterium]|nr:beta-lactamase family protein [Bacteroidia bacterium]